MADDIVERLRHVAWLAEEGSEVTDLAADAADTIATLRAVLDAIDARHMPRTAYGETFCLEDAFDWPCPTHLLIHPDGPA